MKEIIQGTVGKEVINEPNPARALIVEMRESLERQSDNMAFVLNHMHTANWGGKFSIELDKDRETLAKATDWLEANP